MLDFEPEFFEGEEREGYYVEPLIKKVWATELDILSYIIKVCEENNITYYADWGTLLGAVRHKGFIPWDDDCDIVLKRPDYNRLIKILCDNLPEEYYLSSVYAKGNHMQPFSCLMSGRTLPLPQEKITRFYNNPIIAGVDIYVIDYVPRDEELAGLQFNMCGMVYDLAQRYDVYCKEGMAEEYILKVEELCNVKVERGEMTCKNLWRLYDNLCGMFTEEEADMLTWFSRPITGETDYYIDKKIYEGTIEVPFENLTISIPSGYDELLKMKYGNYHEIRVARKHPSLERQIEFLKGKGLL